MIVDASLQFPTVVFTIGLGIALLYWVFVLIGALDIDLLGGGDVDVTGAAKGVGEMITGGPKGGAEALKGMKLDSGGHGDADLDGDGGFLAFLGLGVVPMTISVSVILLVCWAGSLLLMYYVGPSVQAAWFSAVVLLGMMLVAMPVTGLLVRPLAPIFRLTEGKSNRDYVGHLCTITTGHVDDRFGQASVEDGGTVLEIPVRCDRSGVLARGGKALIIDFDEVREAYVVEPSADMLGEREPAKAS